MKKLLTTLGFMLVVIFCLAGCSATSNAPTTPEMPIIIPNPPSNSSETNNGVLIAYFSLAENMETGVDAVASASMALPGDVTRLAKYIQDYTNGDIFSIRTVKKYPNDFQEVVNENHNETSNPALQQKVSNIEKYDTIFIGYPVWATTVPRAIRTFISENDLSNKTVIPFCSHDGYGAGSSYSTIKSLSGATTLEGYAVLGIQVTSSQNAVNAWLERIGIKRPVTITQTQIEMVVGDVILAGVLNDTEVAKEFLTLMPQTMTLSRYADREYYGGIYGRIRAEGERKRVFAKGEISYCPANNTFAVWFDKEEQTLGMDIIKIGEITSDYMILKNLSSSIQMTIRLAA